MQGKFSAVRAQGAPQAIGPYSQAIDAGDTVFLSGQIPLDPATGKLVEGDAAAQAHRVMQNIAAILAAAELAFEDVVKTTVFLADMNDFAAVNAVYEGYLAQPYPARSCVQVAALPRGAAVEIEVVARRA